MKSGEAAPEGHVRFGARRSDADALVLVLHGVGSSAAAMRDICGTLAEALPAAHVVALSGPAPFDGGAGRQWFSIAGVTDENRVQRVETALPHLEALIDVEAAHASVGRERIALVGFSQGAMMALHHAVTSPRPVGAVSSVAGRLVGRIRQGRRDRPDVLLSHGAADAVIPLFHTNDGADRLTAVGFRVCTQLVPHLGHAVAPVQVALVIDQIDGLLLSGEKRRAL